MSALGLDASLKASFFCVLSFYFCDLQVLFKQNESVVLLLQMIPESQSCSPADAVSYSTVAKGGLSLESELCLPFDVV